MWESIKNFVGLAQKPIDTRGRDVIEILNNGYIIFNGMKLRLDSNLQEAEKIFGIPTYKNEKELIYSNNGIRVSYSSEIDRLDISIVFKDYEEDLVPKDVVAFHFKGVVKIAEGYLDKDMNFLDFRKSESLSDGYQWMWDSSGNYEMYSENREVLGTAISIEAKREVKDGPYKLRTIYIHNLLAEPKK